MEADINVEGLKETIQRWLVQNVVKMISMENVRELLNYALGLFREKSNETESVIDDWMADAFESIIADDSKVQIITDFIKSKLSGNICMNTRPELGLDEYDELTRIVMGKPIDDRRCESGKFEFWFSMFMRFVVPIVVEYLKSKTPKDEETK